MTLKSLYIPHPSPTQNLNKGDKNFRKYRKQHRAIKRGFWNVVVSEL